jgi:hypothetical protein
VIPWYFLCPLQYHSRDVVQVPKERKKLSGVLR